METLPDLQLLLRSIRVRVPKSDLFVRSRLNSSVVSEVLCKSKQQF
jgi:hypothetical protein